MSKHMTSNGSKGMAFGISLHMRGTREKASTEPPLTGLTRNFALV